MSVSQVDEAPAAAGKPVATTVRLDPDRHDRLQTLAFHTRRSMHSLLVEGVDVVLAKHTDLETAMFKLNRLTDYGVVVLTQMTRNPNDLRTARQIAQDTGVPLPTVAKLLNALAHERLITSHRGAAGGYTLNRPPEDISVAEIIQALEGPIALTACVDGASGGCDIESLCPMRGNWDKVNKAIHGALSQVTLANMATSTLSFGITPEPGAETAELHTN